MAKTATKAKATPKTVTAPHVKRNTSATGISNADAPTPSLPASLIGSLPVSTGMMASVKAFASDINELSIQAGRAKKSGAVSLARAYVVLHRMQGRIDEQLKPFYELVKRVKEIDCPEAFDAEKVPSITLDEGFRVGISYTTRAGIKAGQKEMAIEWLKAHDKGDVVQPTINASTLSALAKQMGEENVDLPSDIFNVALVPNTSVTKTK